MKYLLTICFVICNSLLAADTVFYRTDQSGSRSLTNANFIVKLDAISKTVTHSLHPEKMNFLNGKFKYYVRQYSNNVTRFTYYTDTGPRIIQIGMSMNPEYSQEKKLLLLNEKIRIISKCMTALSLDLAEYLHINTENDQLTCVYK